MAKSSKAWKAVYPCTSLDQGGNMAKKYYAVKKGNKPGVYKTWSECKAQVDGYSGAVYKSFPSMEEAKKFVSGGSLARPKQVDENNVSGDANPNFEKIVAYVDGSYNNFMKVYSGGSVILYKGKTYELSKVGNDSKLVDMRNVAGELLGVKNVINWILDNDLKNVSVKFHYDYEGIERWANYEWKANKEGTKEYQKFIESFRALGHEVLFVKVKAHSGIFYNEEADRLAGEAIINYQATGKLVNEDTTSKEENISKETSKEISIKATSEETFIKDNSEKLAYENINDVKSEYRVLFEKVFEKETDERSKFQITYGKYDLSEKDITKFIKSTWKSKGYLIKDIKDMTIVLDVEDQMIKWNITNGSGDVTMDEFKM